MTPNYYISDEVAWVSNEDTIVALNLATTAPPLILFQEAAVIWNKLVAGTLQHQALIDSATEDTLQMLEKMNLIVSTLAEE